MQRNKDKDTRYFIDINLESGQVLGWDYDNKYGIAQYHENIAYHRVFISKGQYNKLEKHYEELALRSKNHP